MRAASVRTFVTTLSTTTSIQLLLTRTNSFSPILSRHNLHTSSTALQMASSTSWPELQTASELTAVGNALTLDAQLRKTGYGSPHVSNTLRLFDKPADYKPLITLYRDEAGWCPYCEKTIMLIEEKKIPCYVSVVPMRSYGDKPAEFLKLVPNGLLPALVIEDEATGRKKTITESQVIMEILDGMHPVSEGYVAMLPDRGDDDGWQRTQVLARLERELFSAWCGLIFRPEMGGLSGGLAALQNLLPGDAVANANPSPAMKTFIEVLDKVDTELRYTPGPWFFESDHPLMIDLIFVSHIERMLASCAHWKGLQIRGSGKWKGIDAWFDAFDQRESYLAFKSDFYTNIMDIPPQYGPGYDGGFESKRKEYSSALLGQDGKSWNLPLSPDVELEPLFKGPPLNPVALEAAGITDYTNADQHVMQKACRQHAGWKLASNGENVSKFAARGGSKGASNNRKRFQAPLADPYANPDTSIQSYVSSALQIVCRTLLDDATKTDEEHDEVLAAGKSDLVSSVPSAARSDVANSLAYVRDRVGVPRDMPLAAARQFRAHLNWAISSLK